jgi:16S rRNA (uracil1498-N3)-methyltransferase
MMRIYHPHTVQSQQSIHLEKAAAHHVGRVLRARVGDRLCLFNGKGAEYAGVIANIDKHNVTVLIEKSLDVHTESPFAIHLGQALLLREKMDWVIQKAVELGVASITPIITARSQPPLSEERYLKRKEHWQNIIIHACEQCGRATLPTLYPPRVFSDWVPERGGILCDPFTPEALEEITLPDPATTTLLIGSEGGFTPEEMRFARQCDWQTVQLGSRILRTETATIAMLAILQARFGDMR